MLDSSDTRAVRRDAMRDRILKAAWKLARKEGLAAFSLRDLAKAVGLRAPSLYSYFDSKAALYDAMFADGNREFARIVDDLPESDFEDTFREAARRMLRFGTSDPARYQLLFQRTIPGFEPSPGSYAIAVDLYQRMQQRFAEAGLKDSQLDLWTCISTGIASQQMANDPGGDRYERLIDDAIDMFLDHVGYERKGKKR